MSIEEQLPTFVCKDDRNAIQSNNIERASSYILKVKKFAEPPFQAKKIAEKVRTSRRHFWAIWGNFGSFLGHFGSFWIILGPFWAFLGHIWATLGHLGSFLAILGPFCGIFGQICRKFKFVCGIVGVMILAFRMYVHSIPS